MSDFVKFSNAVHAAYNSIIRSNQKVFMVDITGDELWQHYLSSFPEGSNPIFKERTEHDCSCCKSFVRAIGAVVTFTPNMKDVVTVWDNETGDPVYDEVSKSMAQLVRSKRVSRPFLVSEKKYGAKTTRDEVRGINWNHFHAEVPQQYMHKYAGTNQFNEDYSVTKRSLVEISKESIEIVEELISQNSLYRGAEFKQIVKDLKAMQGKFFKLKTDFERNAFLCVNSKFNTRYRNTVIGTLLSDLSEGVELEKAVASFESKVAPTNYKRPTALVTGKMIENAKKKVAELGIEESLARRHASKTDISVNDVLFVDRDVRTDLIGGVFDKLKPTKSSAPSMEKVVEVSVETFLKDVLPKADSVEMFVGNALRSSFMTLVAPQYVDAKALFKWDNGFSWSYDGDVTDSIKERVKKAGGKVDGDIRVSLSWYNSDDLDLHLYGPNNTHVYFSKKSQNGFNLDVDMNAFGLHDDHNPVENITADFKNVKPGKYEVMVHQFNKRCVRDPGFAVEIEIAGELHTFTYDKSVSGYVPVCKLDVKRVGSNVTVKVIGDVKSGGRTFEKWGLTTEQWVPVDMIMKSPNYWENSSKSGNEHLFFILKGCKNPDDVCGFYNEFLRNDLTEHRKVFELLASSMKVAYNDDQLSGIGISSTRKEKVLVRVKGATNRIVSVQF